MIAIDSSSLILMAKSGFLEIITSHIKEKLTITNKVYNEIIAKDTLLDTKIIGKKIEENTIFRKEIKNIGLYKKIQTDFNLGESEAEVIIFCLENKSSLITDDKKAINACKVLGIKFTTALNLLIRIYENGLIKKSEFGLCLNKLKKFGRYSETIIQKAMEEIKNGKNV